MSALVGAERGSARIIEAARGDADLGWGYTVDVGASRAVIGVNVLIDVVYGFETIRSVSERVCEMAEFLLGYNTQNSKRVDGRGLERTGGGLDHGIAMPDLTAPRR